MIGPLDRSRRDSTLFQFTTKQLRDFIDPNHLLIRIDESLDFAKLVAPLEEYYCPDFGRPAIHPEVMVRALLICSLYNIVSFRRLRSAISENPADRWFCFLTIYDPVFDHSSISHCIDRIGQDGFAAVFEGLNDELLRLGLLSPEMYADGSLVKANVSSHDLSRSGLTLAEFKEQAIEINGLFLLSQSTVDEDGMKNEEVRYFQDPKGKLPLSAVDTDARWRNSRPGPAFLSYEENIVVDRGGFILARRATHSSQAELKVMPELLEQLPISPVSLAADTDYSAGQFRQILEERRITAHIPIHPVQENALASKGDSTYHGDHLVCRQGKVSYRSGWMKRDRAYQYVAHQRDCQRCPVKEQCLPGNQKRRYVALSMYHPWMLLAQQRNSTAAYRQEKNHRRTIVEGTFASLDRLGRAASRLRGLWKVDCEGYMAALAHNVLKIARRMGRGIAPHGPASPDAGTVAGTEYTIAAAMMGHATTPRCFSLLSWLVFSLRPVPR